jgi:hypothetical protein
MVRDADFDDGANCLTDPLANYHLEKDVIRAWRGAPLRSVLGHKLLLVAA